MPDVTSYVCGRCGERHHGVSFAYAFNAPAYWGNTVVGEDDCVLEEELCIIRGESFFIRARIIIPVTDADTDFEWGVWVSLSLPNFSRTLDLGGARRAGRARSRTSAGSHRIFRVMSRRRWSSRPMFTPSRSANGRSSSSSRPTIRSPSSSAPGSPWPGCSGSPS